MGRAMNDWSFADSERAQLVRWAELSYAQRLHWLWEAKMFAQRAIESARARSMDDGRSHDSTGDIDREPG